MQSDVTRDDHDGPFVQSLARGLSVITAFDSDHATMTLSSVAAATGLSRASVRRLLLTLAELGYVRTDGKLFALTPAVLELGYSYLSSLGLPEIAQPHLEKLSRNLGESTSASVFDEGDIVYIARVPVRRIMSVSITIGTRFPAYATSMGRVLLAAEPTEFLDAYLTTLAPTRFTPATITDLDALRAEVGRVREQGWSVVDQELESGLRSVAVPVVRRGRTVAAVNISTSTASEVRRLREEYVPALLAVAADIRADLERL
jgi:IclR family pca regulon transcriptional regulator